MALTATLTNPSYGYIGNGSVSYSVTLNILSNTNIIKSTGLSVTTNIVEPGWADRMKAATVQQADEYIAQLKLMMQVVNSVYPTAQTPEEAVAILTSEITITI